MTIRTFVADAAGVLVWLVGMCTLAASPAAAEPGTDEPPAVAAEIRAEALRPNLSPDGLPLPLASHWNTGSHRNSAGWAPKAQLALIAAGHHILPVLAHPRFPGAVSEKNEAQFVAYYRQALQTASRWKLPLVLKATQWESVLSREPFVDLPPERNPNVVTPEGKILRKVSPFGPVEPWREAGRLWTDNEAMRRLQQWYPDPPLVIFLSNNEHSKLRWHQVEQSQRYMERYGPGKDDGFKRRVVAQGWIERYRALQQGMREGLSSRAWREAARFVGYDAFGPPHMGRWSGWSYYSLYTEQWISPAPVMWDGGSPSYYVNDWNPNTDYTAWSPQIEFMNLVFMKKEALRLNPAFWLEMSVWDGANQGSKKHVPMPELYRQRGQLYDPLRYAGFVQFGMWLLRPRAVREFRGWTYPSDQGMPYYMALVEAVDRVYDNDLLRRFWRLGRLVPNRRLEHFYKADVPGQYRKEDRWFLLDCSLNPKLYPWELHWEVRVFALALVLGDAPRRQWLVYAHSPLADRSQVELLVPEYGPITVDVSRGGSFYLVDEQSGTTRKVAP